MGNVLSNETKRRRKMATKKMGKSARTKRLTLQNLIAEQEEIWVINRSAEVTGREAGNIVLQVGTGAATDVVVIPPGKDPVCLTDQVTPKLLADCMDLFKLVKSKGLELLDPAEANSYYEANEARRAVVESKIDKFVQGSPKTVMPKVKSANVQINPKIGDICLKSKHAAMSEHEALEKLMEQEAVLTIDDYSYLMANGVYNGVRRWAETQQRRLVNTAVVEETKDPVEAALGN
jgi:hypothetical protein